MNDKELSYQDIKLKIISKHIKNVWIKNLVVLNLRKKFQNNNIIFTSATAWNIAIIFFILRFLKYLIPVLKKNFKIIFAFLLNFILTILFYSIISYYILFYSILLWFVLFYFILLYYIFQITLFFIIVMNLYCNKYWKMFEKMQYHLL